MEPQLGTAGLPRTMAALLLSSSLAPLLFMVLNLLWTATIARGGHPSSSGSPDRFNEIIGLGLIFVILGAPASIGVALVAGLPGIYLARRLHLTSPYVFGIGGALLALGCTAWFVRDNVRGLTDVIPFAAIAAQTGAICGVVYWLIAERPRRAEIQTWPASSGRD